MGEVPQPALANKKSASLYSSNNDIIQVMHCMQSFFHIFSSHRSHIESNLNFCLKCKTSNDIKEWIQSWNLSPGPLDELNSFASGTFTRSPPLFPHRRPFPQPLLVDTFQPVKGVKLFHDRLKKPLLQTLPSPIPKGIFSFHHEPDTFTLHISFQASSQNKLKQPFIFLSNIVVRILPETTESPVVSFAQRTALPIPAIEVSLWTSPKVTGSTSSLPASSGFSTKGSFGLRLRRRRFLAEEHLL